MYHSIFIAFPTLQTPQDLFMVNYIKPKDVLVDEIIKTVQSINDREKIETIYKIIMAIKG